MARSQGVLGTLFTGVPTASSSRFRRDLSSSPRDRPTYVPIMRTLGFRSHVLLVIAAAVGVFAALSEPWYAPAPQAMAPADGTVGSFNGPVEGLGAAIGRWISESTGTTGWDALGTWGIVLAALATLTALGALGCLV